METQPSQDILRKMIRWDPGSRLSVEEARRVSGGTQNREKQRFSPPKNLVFRYQKQGFWGFWVLLVGNICFVALFGGLVFFWGVGCDVLCLLGHVVWLWLKSDATIISLRYINPIACSNVSLLGTDAGKLLEPGDHAPLFGQATLPRGPSSGWFASAVVEGFGAVFGGVAMNA